MEGPMRRLSSGGEHTHLGDASTSGSTSKSASTWRAARVGSAVAVAVCVAFGSGCALLGPSEPPIPPAPAREIDIYATGASSPDGPLESAEAAVTRVLANDELLRHIQGIDARYSGRRRTRLVWSASATYSREAPEDDPHDRRLAEERGDEVVAKVREEVETIVREDGGFWTVNVTSDVRETRILYDCQLRLRKTGAYVAEFSEKTSCVWR